MNRSLVDRIVNAVLYEGYILYPYRPSVKNRQRWTFGGLYPEAYCRAQAGSDASSNQTECLVAGGPDTIIDAAIRFLHLTDRRVGEVVPPLAACSAGAEPSFRFVETLRLGDRRLHSWQEAEEREVSLGARNLDEIQTRPHCQMFTFPGRRWLEPVAGPEGEISAVLVREQQTIEGAVELSAVCVAEGLFRVSLRVINRTPLEVTQDSRDAALMRSLVSTHAVLAVRGGEFVSLLDPPQAWRDHAATCQNVGTFPVLVGEEGQRDTMLSSPIILYDYPEVAPESPGDLFDATEIDEILNLRILTLTEEEKRQVAAVDERAGALLARTERLTPEQMLGLHGTMRRPRLYEEDV